MYQRESGARWWRLIEVVLPLFTAQLMIWEFGEKLDVEFKTHSFHLSFYRTVMGKSKAKRRQQDPDSAHISKKSKTTDIITPPPDTPEPKTLRSVGLEEDDLDIAIDTLRTLAENPSVIKSKACKDLRTAVYEFRQACTTGFNTSGTEPSCSSQRVANLLKAKPTSRLESAVPLPMEAIQRLELYLRK